MDDRELSTFEMDMDIVEFYFCSAASKVRK